VIDEKSPKTALSVMSILSTNLKSFEYLKDGDDIFSIRDWIKDDEGKGCLFLTSTGDLHQSLTSLISAWINIAITNVLSLDRKKDRKIWFIIDELPTLHNLPSLQQGLAETRQFGGCFVLSIQSISQLRDRYGSNGSQTISSLCNNKVFLRAGDHESAKWYSDNIGITEIEEFREGLSYGAHQMRDGVSINHHKQSKPLVLPTELVNLGDLEGYFQMAKCFPVAKVKFDHTEWPIVAKRMMERKKEDLNSETIEEVTNNDSETNGDSSDLITI
jgi:type IV secretory pathway TraG/TraD family ATPase VirD4